MESGKDQPTERKAKTLIDPITEMIEYYWQANMDHREITEALQQQFGLSLSTATKYIDEYEIEQEMK